MEKRKQKELQDAMHKKKADEEIARQQLQERMRSVAVDPNAIKSIMQTQSSGSTSGSSSGSKNSSSSSGGGSEILVLVGLAGAGAYFFLNQNS